MRIVYFSSTCYSDVDIALIGELQDMGYDVAYYNFVASFNLKSPLYDLGRLYPHTGIFPASVYPELTKFDKLLDLSRSFVINQAHKQKFHPLNLLLMAWFSLKVLFSKADIIILTSAPRLTQKLLYFARKKIVMIVHDPFMHDGEYDKPTERARRLAFRIIPKLVILNKEQRDRFISNYNIPQDRVFTSKLGPNMQIAHIVPGCISEKKPYILFFGRISYYKGVDVLLKAMELVHMKFPDLNLVVAGSGDAGCDLSEYKDIEYIDLRLRYFSLSELSALLNGCEFTVCPYRTATQSGVVQTSLTMKVPVIVTDTGSLPESVGNGEFGLVAKPDDVADLADSIIHLYSNPALIDRLRRNIINGWIPANSWHSVAEDFVRCFNASLR